MKYTDLDKGYCALWPVENNEKNLIGRVAELISVQPTAKFEDLFTTPSIGKYGYTWHKFNISGPLNLVYVSDGEILEVLSIDSTEIIELFTYNSDIDDAFYECENQFIRVYSATGDLLAQYYVEKECELLQDEEELNEIYVVLEELSISKENTKIIHIN